MDWYRIRHTLGLCLTKTAVERAQYLKKHDIFYHMGDNCMTMFRKIPLYPKLISFGNNVWIASGVSFVTHDVIHRMLNNCPHGGGKFNEHIGCIEIKDNVFVGSHTTILYDVLIGSNTIIAAGSLVNKSLPGNGVYAGRPAKYICSIEEFAKRKRATDIDIIYGKGGLSEETIQNCWEHFRNMNEKHADV